MHLFDAERRFLGGYGIVGGNLPLAAGVALSADYSSTDDAVLCMFGDGASNQGTFGEAMNLAALWRLPVVYMVINNQFGMGTALERHSAVTDLSQKAEGFGIPGSALRRDGRARRPRVPSRTRSSKAREERRPQLVEAVTYRFRGHSMADPEEYRTKEEVEEWRRRDPIDDLPGAPRGREGDQRGGSGRARREGACDASTRRSSSPTARRSPTSTRSTTTSTSTATRCAAGTPSTSARPSRTGASASATPAASRTSSPRRALPTRRSATRRSAARHEPAQRRRGRSPDGGERGWGASRSRGRRRLTMATMRYREALAAGAPRGDGAPTSASSSWARTSASSRARSR